MSSPRKCAERRLTVAMVACLTGFAPSTVRQAFQEDTALSSRVTRDGRVLSIPVSAYNAWTGGRGREPERMVSTTEARRLTGLHKNTVLTHFKTDGRLRPHVVCLCGRLMVPVSAYNAWIEDAELFPTESV